MPTSGQFVVGELVTSSDANQLFTRGYQNRVINGAFVINQRAYTSGTNLASGSYGLDRWKSAFTNTSLTFTAGSQSTTVTISTSGIIQQIIERENIVAGNYCLSFFGTATGRVYNVGATPPAFGSSGQTVALDGLANVVVEFTAVGGTRTLGNVQLEAGTVFSPFEFRHRGQELSLCQRYFVGLSPSIDICFFNINSTNVGGAAFFPSVMRSSPTIVIFNGSTANQVSLIGGGTGAISSVGGVSNRGFSSASGTTLTGLAGVQFTYTASAEL